MAAHACAGAGGVDSLRERLLATSADAQRLTGRSMPGPLPAGDKEYAVTGQTSKWETHD